MVDIFTNGLSFDFLRIKVLRENPKTLENAVQVAMREQNLRKRLALRSQDNGVTCPLIKIPPVQSEIIFY